MTQALNYTIKAIEALAGHLDAADPLDRAGYQYLMQKLRQAQVFILPDYGELLDRNKPRPEVPGIMFKPSFPVVALEYAAPTRSDRGRGPFEESVTSKRISLAWEWTDDLPPVLRRCALEEYGPGVAVASLVYYDERETWLPISGAMHIPFDGSWMAPAGALAEWRNRLLQSGRITQRQADGTAYSGNLVPLAPGAIHRGIARAGADEFLQMISADLMDEVGAYFDLCYALGCRNVLAERHEAPAKLNRRRLAKGRLPFVDYHVLKLRTAAEEEGGTLSGESGSRRAHLRRGHIRHLRHLGPDRITWVNATMVRGRGQGFVRKDYALSRAA